MKNDWGNWKYSAGKEGTDEGHEIKVLNAMVIPTLTYGCEVLARQAKYN